MRNGVERKLALTLLLALAPAGACPASEAKKLPEFRLDSMRISSLPGLPDGRIPPVPPPVFKRYSSLPETGSVRLDSLILVTIEGEAGSARINFPRADYGEAPFGFRASLFIKFAKNSSEAVLSWAAVVCSGRQYLGYKGSSLKLPDKAGEFSIKDETLSLGPAKTLLGSTHPWLLPAAGAGGSRNLDRLCSADFPRKMKAYAVKALPAEAGGFKFSYDPATNALKVTWPE